MENSREAQMREAFEKAIYNNDGNGVPLDEVSFMSGWQASRATLPKVTEAEIAKLVYDVNRTAVTGMIDGHFVRDLVLDFDDAKKHNVDGYIDATDAARAILAKFPILKGE